MTVNHSVMCSAIPNPPTNAPAATTAVEPPAPSASSCGTLASGQATQATSGRTGRWRIAANPPATVPTPPTVRMTAQAPAPPSRSSAITGPSTTQT